MPVLQHHSQTARQELKGRYDVVVRILVLADALDSRSKVTQQSKYEQNEPMSEGDWLQASYSLTSNTYNN
ncbi:hypothetical protein L1887_20819 [Cichorium endivia]|nr:hypothetical protein L1887_20819 [Cichorium endivia]